MMDKEAVEKVLREYEKDTFAYFPDEVEGWILGQLRKKIAREDHLWMDYVIVGSNQGVTFESSISQMAKNGMVDLPPLKNPEIMDLADDLAQLSHLHEPAVFWGVKNRFNKRYIYTYSGIVLIAMNPFERLDMYSVDTMREYAGKTREELEPHVFAIAEESYRAMLRGNNQSIIVSGESGAGKTQSTKYIMRYFATVDSLSKMDEISILMRPETASSFEGGKSEIEQAVLATNPILEAFGNAKTTRNDNSSRFGKFIELFFSRGPGSVRITGARIRTYLLERSRLVFQPFTERNYHIFYQLCAAAPAAEREELALSQWQAFTYLNQGRAGVVKNMDDAAEFTLTQKALSTIGIPVSMQWSIFRICAALLHLGNVQILEKNSEASEIADTDVSLDHACRLLKLDKAEFKKWLTKRLIVTRGEKFTKDLKVDQAVIVRDSVAKFIYTRLFDWLVKIVNKNLVRDSGGNENFIGVLDIYGFEHFETNSFEQFCINYANEKLQQEFNSHVFRLEQELYMKEEIKWTMIDFNDNQPCIDLIEGKLGVLDLLDEESRLPAGNDLSFISKLHTRFTSHKFFEKPRFDSAGFTVRHYAVDVTYSSEGFIEKNKDTVSVEQHGVLSGSGCEFLRELVELEEDDPIALAAQQQSRALAASAGLQRKTTTGKSRKPTLGSMFKASLVQLMETIRATESHYIRCIKPNMAKTAFGFEGPMVLSQLRACGVLETIKISCAGYPNKMTHKQFANRYNLLVNSKYWKIPEKMLSEMIVKSVISDEDKYQFGITQVFLRAGQIATFENRRTERQNFLIVLIQKNMRRYMKRKRYVLMRKSTITIQTALRGYLARKEVTFRRETRAATLIQKAVRGWVQTKKYRRTLEAIVKVQSAYRMFVSKKMLRSLRREKAAVLLQSVWRGYRVRQEYRRSRRSIIYLQSCIRRKRARRELAQLKVEAKSVGKLKEVNYGLETKIVALSQQLQGKAEEVRGLMEKVSLLETSVNGWKERYAKLESGKKVAEEELEAANALSKELAAMTESRDGLLKERERLMQALKKKEEEMVLKEEEGKRLAEKLRVTQGNKRLSMVTASVSDDPVVQALRTENIQLKRLLAQQNQSNSTPNVASSGTPPSSPPDDARPPLPVTGMTSHPQNTPQNSPRPAFLETFDKNGLLGIRQRPMARRANSYIDSGILEDAERARLRLLAENLSKAEAKSRQDATRQVMNEEELIKARETAKEEAEMRMREVEARKQAEAKAEALEKKDKELRAQTEMLVAAKAKIEAKMEAERAKADAERAKAKLEEERRMKEVEEHKMMLAEVVAQKAVLVEAVSRVRRSSRDSSGSRASADSQVRVDVNGYPVSTPPSELNSPVVHQPHPIPSVGPYDRRFAPSPTRGSPTHPTFHSLQSPITNQPFSPPLTSPASSHSSRTPLHDAPHNTNSYFPQPRNYTPPPRSMSNMSGSENNYHHNPLPSPASMPPHDIPQRVGSGTFPTSPHDMYPKAPSPQPSVASSARSGDYGGRRTSDASFGGAIHGNGRTSVDGGGMRAPTIGPRKDQLHYTNGVNGSGGATMRNALPARVYSLEKDTGTLEQRALEQPELIKEIRNSLVISLKVPVGGAGNSLTRKDVFFPAHLIGYTIRAMLQYDMTIKLQNMMSMIVEDIFNVGVHSDNDMYPIFWISNVQELICIIATLYFTETKKASAGNVRGHVHVLRKLRSDLDSLMTQLMSGYMEDTKRHVAGMAVGAILDTQDLAHMKVEASGSFWSLFGGNAVTGTTGSLVGLKDYLTNLNDIMESYFVTADHRDHILNELLRVLGVTSFNGLLKKRNFSNYKRGAQIHHNVTRLEEWCLKNRVSQGVDYLQRMLQSSKILTLPKTTAEDVEVIYETGYMLNRNQIRHLLQDYPSNDVDEPMSNAFMRIIARKAEETEHMETVFISLDPEPDYAEPMPHPVTVMDNYIPPGLNLTNVAKLVAGFS